MTNKIKNYFLSLGLFVLIICVAMVSIFALQPQKTYASADSITTGKEELAQQHGFHDGWTKISSATTISQSGNYYLTQDITGSIIVEPSVFVDGDINVTICLNGYKIVANNSGSAISADYRSNLTICDCNGSNSTHKYNVGSDGKYNFTTSGTSSILGGVIAGGNAENGGGIFAKASLTIDSVTIAGNSATSGGGIWTGYTQNVNIKNCVIEGNIATNGAGYFSNSSELNITGTTMRNNRASNAGGGFCYSDYNVEHFNITNSIIQNNTAKNGGGVAIIVGRDEVSNSYTFTIQDTTISSNTAKDSSQETNSIGGGIYMASPKTLNVFGGQITGNSAYSGGGVYQSNGTINLSNGLVISSNTVTANVKTTDYESLAGGAGVYTCAGALNAENVTISNNNATNAYGGGLLAMGTSSANLNGANIVSNVAKQNGGGGVYVRLSTTTTSNVFKIGGSLKVYDNTNGNLTLATGNKNLITIGNQISEGARIGITINTSDGKGVFAQGYNISNDPNTYFFDDSGRYEVFVENGALRFQEHYYEGNDYVAMPSNGQISSGYYYLTSDINHQFTISNSVYIDLNGYTITSSGTTFLVQSGQLTIKDSSEDMSGMVTTTGANVCVVVNGGSFTLEGGTLSNAQNGAITVNGGVANITYGYVDGAIVGSVNITGGYFVNGDVSANTVYGISLPDGYNVKLITSTEDDLNYKQGFNYAVYKGNDTHSKYGEVITGSGELKDGFYYLDSDITIPLNEYLTISGDVTICLHGHTIEKSHKSTSGPVMVIPQQKNYYAFNFTDGASLTIECCTTGGYIPQGIFVDGDVSVTITILGGHIQQIINKNSNLNLSLQGGYFTYPGLSVGSTNYIFVNGNNEPLLEEDPNYDSEYPYGVYKKGYSSIYIETNNPVYDGQNIQEGVDYYAVLRSYEGATVNWKFYSDSSYKHETSTMVNAGNYYASAEVPSYLSLSDRTYYKSQITYRTITIAKCNSIVNPQVNVEGTIYTSSSFPVISISQGDTEGVISWDEGQNLIAGTNSYNWTFVPSNSTNYTTVSGTIELAVEEVIPVRLEITTNPVKTQYTALETFDASGMVATLTYNDGHIEDVTDVVVFGDGNAISVVYGSNGQMEIPVVYSENGAELSTSIIVFVSKIVVDVPQAVQNLVYDGTEQTGVTSADVYAVTNGSATNAGEYVATVTLLDRENYKWADDDFDGQIMWTISKAQPSYDKPSDLTVKEGQILSDIVLPQGWTWQDDSQSVGEIGENKFIAIYTPQDTSNYEIISMELVVEVKSAGLSTGAIVGVSVGGCAVVSLTTILLWVFLKKRRLGLKK